MTTTTQTPPDEVAARCVAMAARVWCDVSEETKERLRPLLAEMCEGDEDEDG